MQIPSFICNVAATHQNGSEEKVVYRRKLIHLMGKYVNGCKYHVHHAVLQQEWYPIISNQKIDSSSPNQVSGVNERGPWNALL